MDDDRAALLLDLLAEYMEKYGPPEGPPPSDLLVSELAGDLRESLPHGYVRPREERLNALALI